MYISGLEGDPARHLCCLVIIFQCENLILACIKHTAVAWVRASDISEHSEKLSPRFPLRCKDLHLFSLIKSSKTSSFRREESSLFRLVLPVRAAVSHSCLKGSVHYIQTAPMFSIHVCIQYSVYADYRIIQRDETLGAYMCSWPSNTIPRRLELHVHTLAIIM